MPFVGIYVVMFTDVFRTFFKVSGVVLLFVISFSFGFCALLENQVTAELLKRLGENFSTPDLLQ